MGFIPDITVDEIRDRSDIVDIINGYVPLKQKGNDYWACCPFHQEKTPSFKVSRNRQTYYCFGCQASGNVFSFIMARENLDFPGAAQMLARRAGVIIPETGSGDAEEQRRKRSERETVLEILESVTSWYQQCLRSDIGRPGREYLEQRGIPKEEAVKFQLGYSPDSWDAVIQWGQRHNHSLDMLIKAGLVIEKEDDGRGARRYDRFRGRLMFPIHDQLGRIVGFSARTLDPEAKAAKYINTPETQVFHKSSLLYGLHLARTAFKDHDFALVCEGQLDVMACHRAGMTNAVAPQGTAFTEDHAKVIKRYADQVTFCFDGDAAGQKAAVRSIEVVLKAGLTPRAVVLPDKEDPDSFLRKNGSEELQKCLCDGEDAIHFLFRLAAAANDQKTAQGTAAIVDFMLPALAATDDPVQRAVHCQWISSRLGLPESAVFEAVKKHVMKQKRRADYGRPPAPDFPRGQDPFPREQAPPPPPGQPPQTRSINAVKQPVQAAEKFLLDLALHHGFIAHQLVEKLPHDSISETPVGEALNLVLGLTEQGEWHEAEKQLSSNMELSANPDVGRILVESAFAGLEPENEDEQKRKKEEQVLIKAMEDCLEKLKSQDIEGRIKQLQSEIAVQQDPEALNVLMQEFSELMRRKHSAT